MRAYEIPGWLDGIKIGKVGWNADWYIMFNGLYWVDETGKRLGFHDVIDGFCVLEELFSECCWKALEEAYSEAS